MTDSLRNIVVVGGGTAGWITAAMLVRFVPAQTKIHLVESDAIGTVGVGEATIPQIRLLTHGLGLDEDELLAATQGTFKLGIEFVDWLRPGHRYMHAFGAVGHGLGVTPFHHHWLRGRAAGVAQELGSYIPTALAAQAGRFVRPARGSPNLAYAYHFDAALLAQYLRRCAERAGVVRIEGRVVGARLESESGDVESVQFDDGREQAGDFFIDCSGFRALLLDGALGIGFEDWSHWLPCDRAVAVGCTPQPIIPPVTRATAHAAGWQWRIPLQRRTGNGLVYSAAHMSDDEAAGALLASLDGEAIGKPLQLQFAAGKRRQFWARNVVGIGLASGFMEPLESTSIHMVQSAVARLFSLFPRAAPDDAARDAYNRQTHFEYDRIRDFLILHYHANEREGDFWQHCREMTLPDGLAEKLRQFRAGGRIVRDSDELFTEVAWLQVMTGQGIVPGRWSPLADQLTSTELEAFLKDVAAKARDQVAGLPAHEDFIAQHCASPRFSPIGVQR